MNKNIEINEINPELENALICELTRIMVEFLDIDPDADYLDKISRFVTRLRNLLVGYLAIGVSLTTSSLLIIEEINKIANHKTTDFLGKDVTFSLFMLLFATIYTLKNQISMDSVSKLDNLILEALNLGELSFSQIDADRNSKYIASKYFQVMSFLKES